MLLTLTDFVPEGNILVAPLNWGLGHATRCVPVIDRLLAEGRKVMIASNGRALRFLSARYPDVAAVELPGIDIRYSKSTSQIWAMARQMPHIAAKSAAEHRAIKKLVKQYGISAVISDNRFGLFGCGAHSVYITHQLMIPMPRGLKWAEPLAHRLHTCLIRRFDQCWIPDSPTLKLAGDMAHQYPLPPNARFIGILSRFGSAAPDREQLLRQLHELELPAYVDYFVPASGPEPHKSRLIDSVCSRFANTAGRVLILRGEPDTAIRVEHLGNITMASHLPDPLFHYYLLPENSGRIICRSGYSTIMDLAATQRKAELIPTPGQPEQEYLAQHSQLTDN